VSEGDSDHCPDEDAQPHVDQPPAATRRDVPPAARRVRLGDTTIGVRARKRNRGRERPGERGRAAPSWSAPPVIIRPSSSAKVACGAPSVGSATAQLFVFGGWSGAPGWWVCPRTRSCAVRSFSGLPLTRSRTGPGACAGGQAQPALRGRRQARRLFPQRVGAAVLDSDDDRGVKGILPMLSRTLSGQGALTYGLEAPSRRARGPTRAAGHRGRRAHFASAGPTNLRTAAQLDRLADRSRASRAKLARSWSGSHRVGPLPDRPSAGVVIAESRSSGTASRSSRSDSSMQPRDGATAGAERHELAAARRPCAASSSEQAWS
jgi:hypothetical protein